MANGFLEGPAGNTLMDIGRILAPFGFGRAAIDTIEQRQTEREVGDILRGEAGESARIANQGAARAANARGLTGGLGASLQAEAQGRIARELARDLANLKMQGQAQRGQIFDQLGSDVMSALSAGTTAGGFTGRQVGMAQRSAASPNVTAFSPAQNQTTGAVSQQPAQTGTGQTAGQAGVTRRPPPMGAQGRQTAGLNLQGQQDMEGQGPVQSINIGGMEFPQDPQTGGAIVPPDVALELIRGNPGGFSFRSMEDGSVLLTPSNESMDEQEGGGIFDSFLMGFGGQ